VEVAEADLVAGKVVPPPPPRRRSSPGSGSWTLPRPGHVPRRRGRRLAPLPRCRWLRRTHRYGTPPVCLDHPWSAPV